jgi:hypothetical protein
MDAGDLVLLVFFVCIFPFAHLILHKITDMKRDKKEIPKPIPFTNPERKSFDLDDDYDDAITKDWERRFRAATGEEPKTTNERPKRIRLGVLR